MRCGADAFPDGSGVFPTRVRAIAVMQSHPISLRKPSSSLRDVRLTAVRTLKPDNAKSHQGTLPWPATYSRDTHLSLRYYTRRPASLETFYKRQSGVFVDFDTLITQTPAKMPVFQETSYNDRDLRVNPTKEPPLPRLTSQPPLATGGENRKYEVIIIGVGQGSSKFCADQLIR